MVRVRILDDGEATDALLAQQQELDKNSNNRGESCSVAHLQDNQRDGKRLPERISPRSQGLNSGSKGMRTPDKLKTIARGSFPQAKRLFQVFLVTQERRRTLEHDSSTIVER